MARREYAAVIKYKIAMKRVRWCRIVAIKRTVFIF